MKFKKIIAAMLCVAMTMLSVNPLAVFGVDVTEKQSEESAII